MILKLVTVNFIKKDFGFITFRTERISKSFISMMSLWQT